LRAIEKKMPYKNIDQLVRAFKKVQKIQIKLEKEEAANG